MSPRQKTLARTVGSSSFEPESFLEAWRNGNFGPPADHDLRETTIKAFGLEENDDYVYHATASVTLADVQQAIENREKNGLHAWYRDEKGEHVCPPHITSNSFHLIS